MVKVVDAAVEIPAEYTINCRQYLEESIAMSFKEIMTKSRELGMQTLIRPCLIYITKVQLVMMKRYVMLTH